MAREPSVPTTFYVLFTNVDENLAVYTQLFSVRILNESRDHN
jgi:hypothetical protein